MKIIHIISSFSPGGAEVFVKNLSIYLSRSVEVEVWALSEAQNGQFTKNMMRELQKEGIKTYVLDKRPHKDRVKVLLSLRKRIAKSSPDVINSHLEHVTFFSTLSSLGSGIPIVQTIHSTKVSRPKLQRTFINTFIDRFVAVSKKTKNVLTGEIGIPREKTDIIYNGIKHKKFSLGSRDPTDEVTHLIAVGRLTGVKNYTLLLKAFRTVKKYLENSDYNIPHLNIVGEGELKEDLVSQTEKLGLHEIVNFLGIRDDIPELLANHDIYLMSSKWEGLSISLLEAVASGIPIVATDVGSNNEIIDNGVDGLLVEPNNSKDFAETLVKLIKNPELRKRLSKNAVNKAEDFDIKKSAEKYLALYKKL